MTARSQKGKKDMKKTIIVMSLAALAVLVSCSGRRESADSKKNRELFQKLFTVEEGLEWAKTSDVVLMDKDGCVSGKALWEAFYEASTHGKPASVLMAHYMTIEKEKMSEEYYEQVKDEYPKLSITLLEYDGVEYTMKQRDCAKEYTGTGTVYKHLKHFTGEAPTEYAKTQYDSYNFYELLDDPTLTYEEILAASLSSYAPSQIREYPIYMEYIGKKK